MPDLSKSTPFKCTAEIGDGKIRGEYTPFAPSIQCNSEIFLPAMKFRRISKFVIGEQQDQIIPIQVFICANCGTVPPEFDLIT